VGHPESEQQHFPRRRTLFDTRPAAAPAQARGCRRTGAWSLQSALRPACRSHAGLRRARQHHPTAARSPYASRSTTTCRSSRSRPPKPRAASRTPSATCWAEPPRSSATTSTRRASPNSSRPRRASVTPSV